MIYLYRIRCILLLSSVLFIFGCAAPLQPMRLNYKTDAVDLKTHGVVIMSIDMINEFKPDWPPYKLGGSFAPKIPQADQPARLAASYYGGAFGRDLGERVKAGKSGMTAVLIIPAGEYSLNAITGSSFPGLIGGAIHFPVTSTTFSVKAGQGVYLGHLSIVNKERKDDSEVVTDQLQGNAPWLGDTSFIGQGASGFNKSTPVITYSDSSDRYEVSAAEVKKDYPALQNLKIERTPISIQLGAPKK